MNDIINILKNKMKEFISNNDLKLIKYSQYVIIILNISKSILSFSFQTFIFNELLAY
jgi:hypothetical protein